MEITEHVMFKDFYKKTNLNNVSQKGNSYWLIPQCKQSLIPKQFAQNKTKTID